MGGERTVRLRRFRRARSALHGLIGLYVLPHVFLPSDSNAQRIQFEQAEVRGPETSGVVGVTLILTSSAPTEVTVDYSASGYLASQGVDYALSPGTLTFPIGSTSETIQITLFDDALLERNESIFIALSNNVGAQLTYGTTGKYIIEANDGGVAPFLSRGILTGISDTWTTVTLDRVYSSMVVVCTPNYDATSPPTVVRVRNAVGNQFELRAQNPSGLSTSNVTVHYLVVEEGVYRDPDHAVAMEAWKVDAPLSANAGFAWASVSQGFDESYDTPVTLGQVMSYNDPNYSTFLLYGCLSRRSS